LNVEGHEGYQSGQTFGDSGYKSGQVNKESKGNLHAEGQNSLRGSNEKDYFSGQTAGFGENGNKESKGNLHTEGQNTLRGSNSGQTAGFGDALNKSGEIKK